MKTNLLISFCYTLAYIVVANLLFYNFPLSYFFGGDLAKILMFPAFISFGAAYTSGDDDSALKMILIFFLVIWALIFLLVYLARKTYSALRKK